MVRYHVYGWTRREPHGFAAVVAAVPRAREQKVVRFERIARTESDAMMLLVLMADSMVRKMKQAGHELEALTLDESPPKGLPR